MISFIHFKPKEPPQVSQTSLAEGQSAVETPKQRVQRKVIAQRKKRHRVCNDDEARSARVQEMTNAIERSHKRLREGREQALQLRRDLSEMNDKAILEIAKTKEDSRRVFSELEELQRVKDKEFREWVRSITNSSRQTSEKVRGISDTRSSPGNQDVGRSKENDGESSSQAAGLKEEPEKECSTLSGKSLRDGSSENERALKNDLERKNHVCESASKNEQVWHVYLFLSEPSVYLPSALIFWVAGKGGIGKLICFLNIAYVRIPTYPFTFSGGAKF